MTLTTQPCRKNIVTRPQQQHEALQNGLWLKTWNKLELNIGTWNICSLYTAEALKMLINQLSVYKADIVALQQKHWTGSGILEKQDCTLFHSCDNKDQILDTGLLVSKRIKHLITDFKPITHRICTSRVRGKFFNYSIVHGHAPTKISDNEGKDGFFEAVQTAYDISPRNYIKIVLSNFNAQVSKEAVNFPIASNYSFTNDNGS